MQDKIIKVNILDLDEPTGEVVYAKVPGDFSTTNYYAFEDFALENYTGSYEESYDYDQGINEIFYT